MNTKKRTFGFLLVLMMVLVLFAACGKREQTPSTYRTGSALKEQEEKQESTSSKNQKKLYMMEELNTQEETVYLYSLSAKRELCYPYSLATEFLDKYGNSTSSVHFQPGMIVSIGDLTDTGALSYVRIAKDVWCNDEVKVYDVDEERGIFTIGQTKYRLSDQTKVFSDSQQVSLADIGEEDLLRVIGKDKDILSISVTTGHGYIQLVNTGTFTDSMMCIGDRIFTKITGDTTIEVPEGTYDITVANNGYGGTGSYTVKRDETTVVNLEELKGEGPKSCSLRFIVSVEGASIYLDGDLVNANEDLSIPYGKHSLTVVADGYDTWTKTLVVNSSKAVITLDLSDEEEDEASDETANSTNANSTNESSSNTTSQSSSSSSNNTTSSNSNNTDSSSTSDATNAKLDYLSTISDMLSSIVSD